MTNKGTPKNQDPLSKEDLYQYLAYVLNPQVKDEKHVKDLKRLARRTTTLSDVTVAFKILTKQQEQLITALMDANQIHRILLEKLGVTPEMFEAATEEYNASLKAMEDSLKKQIKQPEEEK